MDGYIEHLGTAGGASDPLRGANEQEGNCRRLITLPVYTSRFIHRVNSDPSFTSVTTKGGPAWGLNGWVSTGSGP